MTVSKNKWLAFVSRLSRTDDAAADALLEYINSHDVDSPAGRRDLVRYAYGICTKYGEAAAELSCQMYDAAAEASGANVPSAEPAEPPSFGEVAKAINGARKQSQNEEHTAAVGARLVKQTGLDTTLKNAIRDGAEFAWVPHGDTCAFCLMLASNGWQNAPKGATTRAAHVHANCDCTYAVRFDKRSGVEGYDPDYYKMLWDEAKEAAEDYDGGTSWQDALNALRREHYEENREKINAQKRAAYAKRMEAKRNTPTDVTAEYLKKAKPGEGKIEIPDGRTLKNRERKNLELISSTFGGDISAPIERTIPGQKNPDYIWRGKIWEEQEPSAFSKNAIDANVREAIHQIAENPGGIVLDIGESPMPLAEVIQIATARLKRSATFDCDLMIIRNGKIEGVIRHKKAKK